jgi:hypothetical protein
LGALSAHPIEDEIINKGDAEGLTYKLRLYSQKSEERLLPSGAKKINLKFEIL